MDDINVSTDIALCRACGKTFSFSEIVNGSEANGPDLNSPPTGAWFEQFPNGFRTGASTRSWMAVFFVPFTCVWSGMSLSGIYGKQILSGSFDLTSSIFGLPFLIGSFFLVSLCAMTVAGKIEVVKDGERLSVFRGVGRLGWTRSYQWSDFSTARESAGRNGFNFNRQTQAVALEGKRRLAFGSMWNDERRYFVLSVLRRMLWDSTGLRPSAIVQPRFR
jgi:hypothetical protein